MEIPATHANAGRLYGPEFAASPAETYQDLRRKFGGIAPVLLEGDVPAWLVLSYREAHFVLSNPQLFGPDSRRWNLWDQIPDNWPLRPFVDWTPSVLHAEGADHQRRAGALSDMLDSIDRTDLTRLSERLADRLIDGFAGEGKADLMTQYAQQVPFRLVAQLNSIPEDEIAATAIDMMIAATHGPDSIEAYNRGMERIIKRVQEFRARPGTGLGAQLVAHPAALTDEEAALDLLMVMKSAQQPTSDWIGNTLRLMLTDDQFSLTLQGGRSSVDQALNEVLWKDTPVQNMVGPWAIQDCEVAGQRIHRGDMLIICLAAANADPHVHPGSFGDVSVNRAHMSFAHGDHACPFAAPEVAEIVAKTAVEVLLDRIPDVELAIPVETLEWRESPWDRGLKSLPVTFAPVAASAHQTVLGRS
jgi:cytochrome P450